MTDLEAGAIVRCEALIKYYPDIEECLNIVEPPMLVRLCRERGQRLAADHSAQEILALIAEVIDDPGIPACNYNDVIRQWKAAYLEHQ